jgi:ATP-dependent Clp protease, protease subunit
MSVRIRPEITARIPGWPGQPGPGQPGWPGTPSTPGWPAPSGPQQLPSTRVWLDPSAPVFERLLEKRIVLASGILDDDAASRLSAQLLALDAESAAEIRLELQNVRADLSAALTLMGILDTLRAPVHAYASGEVSGPALGVLAVCESRSGYPNAAFTFAEPRLDLGGVMTASALEAREQQARRMLDTLYYRLAEVTGREVDEIREDARVGRTLTAAEAIGYGLLTDRASSRED